MFEINATISLSLNHIFGQFNVSDQGGYKGLFVDILNHEFRVGFGNNSMATLRVKKDIEFGKIYHLVLSYSHTRQFFRIYLDGVQVGGTIADVSRFGED